MKIGLVAVVALAVGALAGRLEAQCPDGTPPPCRGARPAIPAANTVAVLYFENRSRDSNDAYLADGLTEEIILRLQQLPRLAVKSRYESRLVRGAPAASPAALGRSLGVRYLVNGTVQRAGERVVVRVELIRADQGLGIWSERYDQTSGNVLDVIDAVARGVATGVGGRLLPAEASDLARRPTSDPVAYQQFLRGNFFISQRSAAALARAVDAYEASTRRDPAFKPALARVAYAYALGILFGVGELSQDTVATRAGAAVARALREAADLSDTWLAQGWYVYITSLLGTRNDLPGARTALARAVQLDPNNAEAHSQLGFLGALLGEDSLGEAELRRAVALEPNRAVSLADLAMLELFRGRFPDAGRWADSAIAADPSFPRGWSYRALTRLAMGDTAGAVADADRAVQLGADGFGGVRAVHAVVRAAVGDTAAARAEAEGIVARGATALMPSPFVVLGDRRRALDVLERMPGQGMRCIAARWYMLDPLRGDPRFERLMSDCPGRNR